MLFQYRKKKFIISVIAIVLILAIVLCIYRKPLNMVVNDTGKSLQTLRINKTTFRESLAVIKQKDSIFVDAYSWLKLEKNTNPKVNYIKKDSKIEVLLHGYRFVVINIDKKLIGINGEYYKLTDKDLIIKKNKAYLCDTIIAKAFSRAVYEEDGIIISKELSHPEISDNVTLQQLLEKTFAPKDVLYILKDDYTNKGYPVRKDQLVNKDIKELKSKLDALIHSYLFGYTPQLIYSNVPDKIDWMSESNIMDIECYLFEYQQIKELYNRILSMTEYNENEKQLLSQCETLYYMINLDAYSKAYDKLKVLYENCKDIYSKEPSDKNSKQYIEYNIYQRVKKTVKELQKKNAETLFHTDYLSLIEHKTNYKVGIKWANLVQSQLGVTPMQKKWSNGINQSFPINQNLSGYLHVLDNTDFKQKYSEFAKDGSNAEDFSLSNDDIDFIKQFLSNEKIEDLFDKSKMVKLSNVLDILALANDLYTCAISKDSLEKEDAIKDTYFCSLDIAFEMMQVNIRAALQAHFAALESGDPWIISVSGFIVAAYVFSVANDVGELEKWINDVINDRAELRYGYQKFMAPVEKLAYLIK